MTNGSNYDNIFDTLSQRLGSDPNTLKEAAKKGSADELLRAMKPNDAQKIRNLLQNQAELDKLMRSEQAQAILKKLSGGN